MTIPPRFLIAGYYGFGNTGDEAILTVLLNDLRTLGPEVGLCVVSGDPQATAAAHGVEAVLWTDIAGILRAAESSDLIVLGGGGLFHDYWGFDPEAILTPYHGGIAFCSSFPTLAALFDKPLVLYAVGVGPLYSEIGKTYTRMAFEQAQAASVRDEASRVLLDEIGLDTQGIAVIADPAFRYQPVAGGEAEPPLDTLDVSIAQRPVLGVALRNWHFGVHPDYWERQVAEALDRFLGRHGGSVLFVPFQDQDDPHLNDVAVAERVRGLMTRANNVQSIADCHTVTGRARLLARCDIVLGMRLHALIFAATSGVPVVGLAYDPKVHSLLAQVGCQDYAIDIGSVTAQGLSSHLDAAYRSRDSLAPLLKERAAHLAVLAEGASRSFVELLRMPVQSRRSFASKSAQVLVQFALSQTRLAVALRASHAEKEQALQKANDRLDKHEHTEQLLRARMAEQDLQVAKRTRQVAQRDQEVIALQGEAAALKRQVEMLSARASSLQAQVVEREQQIHSLGSQISEREHQLSGLMEQLEESGRALAELHAQSYEWGRQIDDLAAQVAERETQLNGLTVHTLRQNEQIHQLTARLAGREAALTGMQAKLAEAEQTVSDLRAHMARRDDDLGSLQAQLVARRHEIHALTAQAAAQAETVKALSAQVATIAGSRGWGLLLALWGIRLRLLPRGSRGEHALRIAWDSIRALRHKGLRAFLRQASAKPSSGRLMSWTAYSFDRSKRARQSVFASNLAGLRGPGERGLVSIVLPVHNGAAHLREAVDSILKQTYADFELIAVNDGSTDESGRILDDYAADDRRIQVIHTKHERLPGALSLGFRRARGEFLTWTSHDNRLHPDFLERMVACLNRRPCWDMAYANLDIIDGNGRPLANSEWYGGYQWPRGSQHIRLPEDPSELNVWPNNYVGAAFLYRDRVATLLGDYSRFRFTSEDYDYWMRVNALLQLRHVDFKQPIYEYRFHPGSLTHRDEELGITHKRAWLMVFDDFRRDFYLTPLIWLVDFDPSDSGAVKFAKKIRERVAEAGHQAALVSDHVLDHWPRLWQPAVYLRVMSNLEHMPDPPADLPASFLKVLVHIGDAPLPCAVSDGWDLCLSTEAHQTLPRLPKAYQGWIAHPSPAFLLAAIDIRARSQHLALIEAEINRAKLPQCKLSVIICTFGSSPRLARAVESVARQTIAPFDYEVLVIDNSVGDAGLAEQVQALRARYFANCPQHLRLVLCRLPGLSHARNAGLAEARGEVICFLDDDALADETWLSQIWRAFADHPDAGVVGGHIRLKPPVPRPQALRPGWEKYWSQFVTGYSQSTKVAHWWDYPWGANWCARRQALLEIGGFRAQYGRRGDDFGGGEEIVAASLIQRLGYAVVIAPQAQVAHEVDRKRFSSSHVRRTILAATLTNYRAQRDLYFPMESSLAATLWQMLEIGVGVVRPRHRARLAGDPLTLEEVGFNLAARLHLLREQALDMLRRMRRPIAAGKNCASKSAH